MRDASPHFASRDRQRARRRYAQLAGPCGGRLQAREQGAPTRTGAGSGGAGRPRPVPATPLKYPMATARMLERWRAAAGGEGRQPTVVAERRQAGTAHDLPL